MKKVKLTLMGFILLATISSCRKMEKMETPKQLMVSVFAGLGTPDYGDGIGLEAKFNSPTGIIADASGNLYVVDQKNQRIRKITPDGVVTTFAGSGVSGFADGTGTAAVFNYPIGITIDGSGNLYVADTDNNRIRKITPAGVVSTYAGSGEEGFEDGPSNVAKFSGLQYLTIDASNNLYVTERYNNSIRKITPAGQVTTVVGGSSSDANGPVATASIFWPVGITIDAKGNLYVSQTVGDNTGIRKISTDGMVSRVAGSNLSGYEDGTAGTARIGQPGNLSTDAKGNIYIMDKSNHLVRRYDVATGMISTFAGLYNIPSNTSGSRPFYSANGPADKALFFTPLDIAFDAKGNAYVADKGNNMIRKISLVDRSNLTQAEIDQQNWNKPKNWK